MQRVAIRRPQVQVYEIDDKAKTVDVTRIAHRREVYE
jgi:mRNA-degrading endonuclease RelE of RelBE toxin-antitoxin system